jgi:myo-inositol-1(or 4)-monophosphatase
VSLPEGALAAALEAAREAGAILSRGWGAAGEPAYKADVDPVTEYDGLAEAAIVARLRERFPGHAILAEEGGARPGDGRQRWVVDPLDGTVNFAHGLPLFAVSIALEVDGATELGVVLAPVLGWEFVATRGGGATLGGKPIRPSRQALLARALLVTGFPYDRRTSAENNFANFLAFQVRAGAVRRLGAASLDLCFVACGWLDGYWEMKLKPWDVAAGELIVREAGGRTSDFLGGAPRPESIVASNGLIHDQMLAVLRETRNA